MEYVKLGDICNIKSSKRIYQSEYSTEGVPFYRGKEISQLQRGEEIDIELFITREKFDEIKKTYGVIKKGDLLITSVGTIGNTWVSDGREFYYKDGNITQIESNDNINTKFIAYLFKSNIIKRQYLKGTSGTAQVALTIEKLNKLQIPNMDLKKQNKIVAILDKVQELIDKRKEQIGALDELVKSKFIEMFGDFSKEIKYELKKINDLVNEGLIEKPLDGNHGEIHPKSNDFVEQGVPFIMANDLIDGKVDYDTCNFITQEQTDTLRKGFAKSGDVLLTHKGTIGKTAIVSGEYRTIVLTPQVTYYRIINGLNNIYLRQYFMTNYFQTIVGNIAGIGSTRAYIGITAQRDLPIVIPPIELQNQFADFVKQVDKLKFEMKRSLEELEDNFNSLMQKSFKGELFN